MNLHEQFQRRMLHTIKEKLHTNRAKATMSASHSSTMANTTYLVSRHLKCILYPVAMWLLRILVHFKYYLEHAHEGFIVYTRSNIQ